jgi:hypothetical protein
MAELAFDRLLVETPSMVVYKTLCKLFRKLPVLKPGKMLTLMLQMEIYPLSIS